MKIRCALTCLACACLPCVGAQASEGALETIVVTGTRLADASTVATGFTSVIDRATIDARNDASVLDLLRSTPGIHVSQPGGRGSVSSVFVQGAEPNFTVVLVDGVKVNDPNNTRGGSFDFATLNLSEIERIEVARGGQSSIYGSDGLSGVINIITRLPSAEPSLTVDVEAGDEGYSRLAAHGTVALGERTQIAAGASTVDDGDAVQGNSLEASTIGVRLRHTGDASYDMSVRFADSEGTTFPEDSGGPQYAVLREVDERDHEQLSASLGVSVPVMADVELNLLAAYLDQETSLFSPGVAPGVRTPVPPNRSKADLDRANLTAYARWQASSEILVTGGFDYQREDGEQVGSVELFPGFGLPTDFQLDRETTGAFAELMYRPKSAISLSASLRRDDPDDQSGETTARLGVQYELGDTRLFAHWGEGFKLPSFFALGHALVGNPNLRPETSRNWSAGIAYAPNEAWLVEVSVFDNQFEDLIDFDFDLFTNVNRNQVDTQGVEVHARWDVSSAATVTAHATYVDIDAVGTKLRQRPDWRGGLNLSWRISDRWHADVGWLHSGDVFDSAIPTGPRIVDGYHRVDANITWSPIDHLDFWLAVDNATDESYEEAIGFTAPGARARLGIRARL
jgi:outer membrane cobalamin receptor